MSSKQLMIDKGHAAMLDNKRMIIRVLSDELGLLFGSVHSIMTRFGQEICFSEICLKTADSRAESDSPCNSQRFAAVC
jgi:hypothetical protein